MGKMKKLMMEDFEREAQKDEIYLQEHVSEIERQYWDWYNNSTGKVIIINEDGQRSEVDETFKEYKLPF